MSMLVALPCAGYIITESESADALERAERQLIDMLLAYDYENQ